MNDNCLEEQIKKSLQKFLFCPINNRTKEEIKEQLNLILNENDFVIEEEDSNISIIVTIDGVETKYEFQM
ncbi:MAG: hypothetical protein RBT49_04135 [Bacteroidales bacterium]|jgi:hypothetical protein|nr:hypothetical protein [Bacteroidales bacterium]